MWEDGGGGMGMKTVYGIKKRGNSEFVILAPHAAGDDLNTKELALAISKKLNASYVINTKFVKPSNKNSKNKYIQDFNKLPIINGKYDWNIVCEEMKKFYYDARSFCCKNSIILVIHGMRSHGRDGIDIGIGLGDYIINIFKRGAGTFNFKRILQIKRELNEFVPTTIGKYFSAKRRDNAIYFFNCESVQLEFSRGLREKENIEFVSNFVSSVFLDVK